MSKKISLWASSWILIMGLGAMSWMGGCGVRQLAQGELAPPKVTLKGLTLKAPKVEGWPLACTLLLNNPNPEPLKLLGYDYEVWLEGQRVVQGESLETLTLPAQGEKTVEVPVFLKFPAIPEMLRAIFRERQLHYEIVGGFRLASLLGGLKVPFRFEGQLTEQEGVEHLRQFLKAPR